MAMWWLVAFLTLLIAIAQIESNSEQFVQGGDLTSIDKHPYLAGIFQGATHLLTGAIISDRTVLTCIHRIIDLDVKTLEIKAGATFITSGTVFKPVYLIAHPKFRQQELPESNATIFYFNVGLLKLRDNERFVGTPIRPVKLPEVNEQIVGVGEFATFAG